MCELPRVFLPQISLFSIVSYFQLFCLTPRVDSNYLLPQKRKATVGDLIFYGVVAFFAYSFLSAWFGPRSAGQAAPASGGFPGDSFHALAGK
jgi:hypothetical protein